MKSVILPTIRIFTVNIWYGAYSFMVVNLTHQSQTDLKWNKRLDLFIKFKKKRYHSILSG